MPFLLLKLEYFKYTYRQTHTHPATNTHRHKLAYVMRWDWTAVWERPMCGDMIWCIFLHPESSDQLCFHLYSVHFNHVINFFSIRCLSLLFHMDNFFFSFYLFLMNFNSILFFSLLLFFLTAVVVIGTVCLCRTLHVIVYINTCALCIINRINKIKMSNDGNTYINNIFAQSKRKKNKFAA